MRSYTSTLFSSDTNQVKYLEHKIKIVIALQSKDKKIIFAHCISEKTSEMYNISTNAYYYELILRSC